MLMRIAALLLVPCVGVAGYAGYRAWSTEEAPDSANSAKTVIPLTIASSNGNHVFRVERAATPAEQEKGLMYRTDLTDDGGMLFWPYPPTGEAKVADFWMKNTPSSLDIIFIRADGSIARIADSTTPFSEDHVNSGEPVGAVLEIKGGRASALGIAEGDKVSWPKTK
jgi:uncharacterized membrane protein (UPF0127 family)